MPKTKQTPMITIFSIKAQYPMLFVLSSGDFYEMFNEDAISSCILKLTPTSRNRNAEDPIPMCGILIAA